MYEDFCNAFHEIGRLVVSRFQEVKEDAIAVNLVGTAFLSPLAGAAVACVTENLLIVEAITYILVAATNQRRHLLGRIPFLVPRH